MRRLGSAGVWGEGERSEQLTPSTIEIETRDPDALYDSVPAIALGAGIKISELISPDNNLEAVFAYLTGEQTRS